MGEDKEYRGCNLCTYELEDTNGEHCKNCIHNRNVHEDNFKKKTNADAIRNMSDEELAEFLAELNACEKCKYDSSMGCLFENPCTKSFEKAMTLEWLQAEVEEGENDG